MTSILVVGVLIAGVTSTGLAQGTPRPAGPAAVAGASPDEAAIREVDRAFADAYNRGDVPALAAMFTEDAEVFEADGARYRGRDFIERSFRDLFSGQKGSRIRLDVESIRFLTADVAKEDGRSVVTPPDGPPVSQFYTVLYVKRDGRWRMNSVREESDPVVRPHDRLKELEWMVGDWVDEGSESHTRVQCRWSDDGNYLLRDLRVQRAGKLAFSVHQRVGWDPVAGEFRSWEFDSDGGFGEGHWSRDGDRWVVKQAGVRPEGVTASSTRSLVRLRSDLVRWTLANQVVAGETVPGEETSVLTRVPPAPRLGSPTPATPPGPNPERSTR